MILHALWLVELHSMDPLWKLKIIASIYLIKRVLETFCLFAVYLVELETAVEFRRVFPQLPTFERFTRKDSVVYLWNTSLQFTLRDFFQWINLTGRSFFFFFNWEISLLNSFSSSWYNRPSFDCLDHSVIKKNNYCETLRKKFCEVLYYTWKWNEIHKSL